MFPRKSLTLVLLLAVAAGVLSAAEGKDSERTLPFGLEKRAPWTTSRLVGTPDPPPPYDVERVFPKLRFKNPVVLGHIPGSGRLLVAELKGKIYSFANDPGCHEPQPFFDMASVIPGLSSVYGLAFHPAFEENRQVYICYVLNSRVPDGSRVSRFVVTREEPPRCDPKSEVRVIDWLSGGHNGGCLQFGLDRYLYISTGDGTGPFPPDIYETGQDNSDLLSAILRIDVDASDGESRYGIPADNPFVGMEGLRPEVWAYGFRNPWKMSFDPATGHLWLGDVGWELWEMVYRVESGGNYGWSVMEGRQPVHPEGKRGPTPVLPPVVDHPHSEARSITGGRFYRGTRLKELSGAYIYADYETGKIWGLRHDGEKVTWHRELCDTRLRIVAFGEDSSGELYVIDHVEGTMHRLVPSLSKSSHLEFPRKLSETGLFSSMEGLAPAAGVLPYSLIAEQWADGSVAQRHLALPGETRIRVDKSPWQFPEGAVLAKTFSLEMERGHPRSRRRLETQILHLHGDVWRGYTYAWNEAQTDATLVEDSGLERTYTIADPEALDGKRRQTWYFPSRAECLLCHNLRSGPVLGFEARQLNRGHDYGGSKDNQLRTLGRIGVLAGDFKKPIEELPHFSAPHDETASVEERARTYLHVNCASCHTRHGGGTSLIELRYELDLSKTNALGIRPALGTFGIPAAHIISAADPYRSVLLYRMATLGTGRMPHVGSSVVDRNGLALIHDWITHLRAEANEPAGLESVIRSRAEEIAALEKLLASDGGQADPSPSTLAGPLERLLGSTTGALLFLRVLDGGALPRAVREEAIARVTAQPGIYVEGLFRRFMAQEEGKRRLGNIIQPEDILALKGDAARGKDLFSRGAAGRCKDCHGVEGKVESVGPDLIQIGKKYDRARLLETIIEPSKSIEPRYTLYLLQTRQAQIYTGLLVKKTAEEVVLKDGQSKLIRVRAREVTALVPQRTSLMPRLLLAEMTAQEVADLLEYLSSLR